MRHLRRLERLEKAATGFRHSCHDFVVWMKWRPEDTAPQVEPCPKCGTTPELVTVGFASPEEYESRFN